MEPNFFFSESFETLACLHWLFFQVKLQSTSRYFKTLTIWSSKMTMTKVDLLCLLLFFCSVLILFLWNSVKLLWIYIFFEFLFEAEMNEKWKTILFFGSWMDFTIANRSVVNESMNILNHWIKPIKTIVKKMDHSFKFF